MSDLFDLTGNVVLITGASSGLVVQFAQALAAEWTQKGITVNAIGPLYFASEMTSAAISDDDDSSCKPIAQAYCPMGRARPQARARRRSYLLCVRCLLLHYRPAPLR